MCVCVIRILFDVYMWKKYCEKELNAFALSVSVSVIKTKEFLPAAQSESVFVLGSGLVDFTNMAYLSKYYYII